MKTDQIRDKYLKAASHFKLLVTKEEKILLYLSALRFFSFTGGLALIWLGFSIRLYAGIFLIPVVVIIFLWLLKLFSDHSSKKEFLDNLAVINQNEAKAVSGDITSFEAGNSFIDLQHDFSNDVDLFGESSLFQYLNRTVTGYGREILSEWLSDPYSLAGELISRQEIIKELSGKEKWRHEFLALGMRKSFEKKDILALLEWLAESTVIKSSSIRKAMIYLLPLTAIISLVLLIVGIVPYTFFTAVFLMNLLYVVSGLKKTNKIHAVLSGKYNYLSSINGLLKSFDNESFNSKGLNDIKLGMSGKINSAAASVKKLGRLIQAFDSRMNILVGFVLNGLLLWDYHCIYRLEKWRDEYRNHFPVWLGILGKVDAFISLGNYSYNNPDFIYPVISDSGKVFSSRNLGHQLIDESIRVCNDFELERPGSICIISGANMAGKSTFLRTVAVNYILGMTGSPVCASEMKFIPLKLITSIRTTDSLSKSESYFYAELKRLRMLKTRIENGEPVLFILDEILKGTNSADKSLGSKLFIKKLVELKATGLVATHDTSICNLENDYPGSIINKCFEVEIDGETISFDYKLQNGITLKMNAALLMKQMGILD